MDDKGRWVDNVFVERLLRSVKERGSLPARARHSERGAHGIGGLPALLQRADRTKAWRPDAGWGV